MKPLNISVRIWLLCDIAEKMADEEMALLHKRSDRRPGCETQWGLNGAIRAFFNGVTRSRLIAA
jgi:hypothetical protein